MARRSFGVWIFRNAMGLIALTGDPEGSSLPSAEGPWHFEKVAALGGDTPDEEHAIGLIEVFGFCCFDEDLQADSVD